MPASRSKGRPTKASKAVDDKAAKRKKACPKKRAQAERDTIDEILYSPRRGVAYSENVQLTNDTLYDEENRRLAEMMLFMLADNRQKTHSSSRLIGDDAATIAGDERNDDASALDRRPDSTTRPVVTTGEYLDRLNHPAHSSHRRESPNSNAIAPVPSATRKSFKRDRFFYPSYERDETNDGGGDVIPGGLDSIESSDDRVFHSIDTDELYVDDFFDEFFASLVSGLESGNESANENGAKCHSVVVPTISDVVSALEKRVDETAASTVKIGALRDLRAKYSLLAEQLSSKRSRIVFHAASHRYYVCGKEMRLSVTKALDLVFGAFDEDLVTSRMIRSSGWKRNKLYRRFNYDERGVQREESEIKQLILNEWKDKRDRGTTLHDYINRNYTNDATTSKAISPSVVDVVARRKTAGPLAISSRSASTTGTRFSAGSSNGRTLREILMGNTATGSLSPSSVSPPPRPLSPLPTTSSNTSPPNELLASFFSRASPSSTSPSPSPVPSTSSTQLAPSKDDSAERTDLLDRANVEAFDRWNEMVKRNSWILLGSEYSVCYERAGLAGTIDAIFSPYAENPNLVVLVDWKRCPVEFSRYSSAPYDHPYTRRMPKCNYWKYAFQLNLYREMVERTFKNVTVIDMLLVNFPPEDRMPRYYSVPRLHEARLLLDDLVEMNRARSPERSTDSSRRHL